MLSFRVIVALHPCRPVFSIPLPLLNPVLRILFQVPYAVTPVFAILTKTAGVVGVCFPFWKTLRPRRREVAFSFKFFLFTLLRTILHSPRTQLVCFQTIPHSLRKNTRGCGTLALGSVWPRVARIQGRMRLWL